MKNIKRYSILALTFISLTSCKKNNEFVVPDPVPEKVISYQNSVSFVIDEKQYIFTDVREHGIGNRAVNVKASKNVMEGKLATTTGGYYWYGEKDSTLYSVSYGFSLSKSSDNFKISFAKKYRDTQIQGTPRFLAPKDHSGILKLGKLPFAVDLDKGNTMDGVSINLNRFDAENLGSSIPGFSILVKSSLTKEIQNNSTFEITKVEHLKDSIYLIEAKFELNLFGDSEKLYRLKNGFLRIVTSMTMPSDMKVI